MPTDAGLVWKRVAMTLFLLLNTAPRVMSATENDPPCASPESARKASSARTADGSANTTPNASDPNAPLAFELRELKKSVEDQSRRLTEHTKEVQAERAALHDALDRIASLEAKLGVAPDTISPPVAAVDAPATTPARPDAQTPEDLSKRVDNLESKLKNFGPFSFSGDFRLRDEPFFGGPSDRSLDRNRERYRLRLNVDAKLNEDIGAGFALATGDVNDPITTNQTTTQFYARKPLSLDRAFVTYAPHQFKPLTLTGGKFAYPWYNTELTWDKDLNPEGLAQTLAFDLHAAAVLKKIALVGFELPFGEVAGVSLANKSIVQSVAYGGQIQTVWQLTRWLTFGAYSGFYNFHNADPIALALAKANAKNPQTPFVGLLPLGSGGNTIQNSVVTTTASSVVTFSGTPVATGIATFTNAQFASKFGLLDSLARLDIITPSERWPVTFIGDYVQNTRACANVGNILPLPKNTSIATYSQSTNFPCNPHQRRGYWGEVQAGRAQKRGDWQFGYARIFVERERCFPISTIARCAKGAT